MHVFAFDRDWTVDVNPHPRREAVPLEWVRHLAHETEHAVYAIGNQNLADEAAIPGVVDIVGRHPDDWDEWLGEKEPDGHYERFPERRERLELVADLHPHANGYVVVDDLDLSDVAGWDHYHAWDFVPAVRRGDICPDLPWTDETVSDGGFPVHAGIIPSDASHLAEFLEAHDDPPAFELTYDDDRVEQTRLLADVSIIQQSLDRPSAAPAIQCEPVPPDGESFSLRVDAVERLSIVEPPTDVFTATAETPAERATGFRRLADTHPMAVDLSAVLTLLEREGDEPQQEALRALRLVAESRPSRCTPAVPILRSLLEEEDLAAPVDALGALRRIGENDPADIAPLVGAIAPYLHEGDGATRHEAAQCIAEIANGDPDDAVDTVAGLATVVEDESSGLQHAIYALSCVTREHPEAVEPVAETLGAVGVDGSHADTVRLNATAALGRLVNEDPSIGLEIVDDIADLLDADNPKIRNNGIGLLGDIATLHTDVVEPYTERIGTLLTVDDDYTRVNASAALARIADAYPDSAARLAPRFRDLLDDEHHLVRENACWALGYLQDEAAKSKLESVSKTDDAESVRTRAMWAITEIED